MVVSLKDERYSNLAFRGFILRGYNTSAINPYHAGERLWRYELFEDVESIKKPIDFIALYPV